ncbi:MAG: arsC1 [Herminiimonas sp.]|nr:arsC1 [Herminiimonas sp.]MDB5854765.1 arsC1 [Herminiimonas sp.]
MSEPDTVLYGIPNCDQVRKARAWLLERHVPHVFHDFKKNGIDRVMIASWLVHQPWEVLLNRRGTTWRGLAEARKASVADGNSAAALMLENSSVIKRPVLVHDNAVHVGYSEDLYQKLFGNPA